MSDYPFPKGTCLIAGDSMLARIEENRLKSGKHMIKVRYFPSACTDDMFDYMKPLLRKLLDYIILHIGTNDALDNTSREILNKIFKLKTYIYRGNYRNAKSLFKHRLNDPWDHGKASLTISHLSKKSKDLSISVVDNSNIGAFYLNSGGLHLKSKGLGRLAINLKLKIRKF